MLNNFRTYQLAVVFFRQAGCIKLPCHLKDQLARASASIVLNLAEGCGRQTASDQRRFFTIAFGSLRECQAVLDLCRTSETEAKECADKLAAHIYKLIKNTR